MLFSDFRETNGLLSRAPASKDSPKQTKEGKNSMPKKVWNMDVENLGVPIASLGVVACKCNYAV